MKITFTLFFFATLLTTSSCLAKAIDITKGKTPTLLWHLSEQFRNPESTYFDQLTGHIYVSNVAGNGDQLDGVGWISKLDANGKVLKQKWVEGLSAPKGMIANKEFLWVSDINSIIKIDKKTAKVVKFYYIKGSVFLNDMALAPDGTLYVSDTLGTKIYQLKGETVSVFVEGKKYESPNGLLVLGKKLYVASWGLTTDWSTKKKGGLYTIDLKSKKMNRITKAPVGNLDGLEVDKRGNFIVSDWMAGKVFKVTKKGKVTTLYTGFKGSADIGLIADKSILLVPSMSSHQIRAFKLTGHKSY